MRGDEAVTYLSDNGSSVAILKLQNDSLWLSQAEIARLFDVKRPAITKHIANIFSSGELDQHSVCSILEHTAEDGKSYDVQHYNLDAIISIGYRVNSTKATRFRQWATGVLRDHLTLGYSVEG